MKLPNDKLEDIQMWMCLDSCNKKKKSIQRILNDEENLSLHIWEGLLKEGSYQEGKFSGSWTF